MFKEVSFALQAAEPVEGEPVLNVTGGLVVDLDINEKVLPHEINYERYTHLSDIFVCHQDSTWMDHSWYHGRENGRTERS